MSNVSSVTKRRSKQPNPNGLVAQQRDAIIINEFVYFSGPQLQFLFVISLYTSILVQQVYSATMASMCTWKKYVSYLVNQADWYQ